MFSKDAFHDTVCYGTALVFIQIRIQSILPQYGSYDDLVKPMRIYADLDPENFYISAFLGSKNTF